MDRPEGLTARMKGRGGVGITGKGGDEESSSPSGRPYPPGIHPGGKRSVFFVFFVVFSLL